MYQYPWDLLYQSSINHDEFYDNLFLYITHSIESHVPVCYRAEFTPIWISKDTRLLKRSLNNHYHTWKNSGSFTALYHYNVLKKKLYVTQTR